MKKIALFIPTLGQGGAERVFLNLANEMVKRHEVSLILQEKTGDLIEELHPNVEIYIIGMRNKLKVLYNLLKYISINKPDVIISTLTIPNILNAFAHQISAHKYILITRQASSVELTNFKTLIKYAIRFAFKRSKFVIANSIATKESIIQILGLNLDDANIKVIYNPVFDEKNYKLAHDDSILNTIVDKNEKYILTVGRLEGVKNFKLLIESFNNAKIKYTSKLVILGEGSQRGLLEDLIKDLGLKDRVLLPGNISNPYPFYKNANLFISSSRFEGFGNVIVEALSFCLPIIYTNSSGAPSEILDYGNYGYEVNNNNSNAMAKKIDEVYIIKEYDRERLINRAKDFAIEKIAMEYEASFQ